MDPQVPPTEDLDEVACWISAARAAGGLDPNGAPVLLMIERLRRFEAAERASGGSRQTLQRIMSARRLLGDMADLGPVPSPAFSPVSRSLAVH